MNQRLAERMCAIIGQAYAMPIEDVIKIFEQNGSIDETNRVIKENDKARTKATTY